ncbi:MAG: class I SAM-dependent methyltransferase [Phycisphaerales bacterium]|nr:class I SAM-dependent methyltransferase [Phycisphaerales bacterium]
MPTDHRRPRAARPAARRPSIANLADRHDLYQRSVQAVDAEIDFVDAEFRRLRGRTAAVLREDFCGTAHTSCEWVRRRPGNSAYGVDLDRATLDWGTRHNVSRLGRAAPRVRLIEGDVVHTRTPHADIVLAMNFSYFLLTDRALLREYFSHVRSVLVRDGVFFLDAYGGYDAFRVLKERRQVGSGRRGFTYIWDQASYNPISGIAECRIHFAFPDGSRMRDAFYYRWRVWSLPEIREVLAEAGFRRSTVYWEGWDEKAWEGDGVFTPSEVGEADAGWICYISAER